MGFRKTWRVGKASVESDLRKENLRGTSHGRNYGIDLLRLVLMFMVCMLHTLNKGGVMDASVPGTSGYKVYLFLETFCYCAVDGFAIISGYTASNRPRKFEKLVDMWFQAFFYSFVLTVILTIVGINETWTKIDMIKCALPVSNRRFWYFTAFFGLYFAIPLLNAFLFSVSEDAAKKALILIVVLFSVMGTLSDPFYSDGGYSAIWLMVLYSIGVLAKRIKLFETRRSITLLVWLALSLVFTWVVCDYTGIRSLLSFVLPTILFSGMIMVVLFSRIPAKGTIISKLSPLAFGIYLFQINTVIWNNILCDAAAGIAKKPVLVGIPLVFGFALAIFLSGLAVEFVRSKLAKAFRIHKLSKWIVAKADFVLEKLFVFLK